MANSRQDNPRQKRAKKPLEQARLQEMALAYVARYATSSAKLERYLRRKIYERGWAYDAPEPDIAGLITRYGELGYIDDEAFARNKSASLLRRGYGKRRVDQTLGQDGISADIREDIAPAEASQRHAALAMVKKRRFGPFGASDMDRSRGEKQIAAMLRAGHRLDSAKELVNAASELAAEQWAHELDEDDREFDL